MVYSETDDEDVVEETFDKKTKVKINVVPEFQVVIDPPSPVHVEDLRRLSADRSGKRKK